MVRCSVPSCGFNGDQGADSDGGDAPRPHRRLHRPAVFNPPDPPQTFCSWVWWMLSGGFWAKLSSFFGALFAFVYGIYRNEYHFGLVKAITVFGFGVKLFNDMVNRLDVDCDKKKACEMASKLIVDP